MSKKTWPIVVSTETNCTVDAPDTYTEGEYLKITATPNDGCRFDPVPYVRYKSASGQIVKLSFTIYNGTATFSRRVNGVPDGETLYVVARAVVIPEKWPVEVRTKVNCSVSAPTSYTEKTKFTATATPADGYRFDTAPVLTDGTHNFNFTIGEDGTASYNGILTGLVEDVTLYIDATAVEIPKTWPVEVRKQVNCSVSAPTSYTKNTTFTATATPAEGYRFDTAPVLTDGTNNFNFTIGKDGTASYNGILTGLVEDVTLYIDATAVEIPKTWPVEVRKQVNCSVSAPTSYTKNTTFTATATPAEGYRFDTAPVLTDGTNNFNFTIGKDGTASYNGILTGLVEDVTLYIDATAVEIPKKTWPITTHISNCVVSGIPSTNVYTEGETLYLTAQANENFKFDLGSIPVVIYYKPGGIFVRLEFTFDPADDTKATFTGVINDVIEGQTITIVAEAIPSTEYVDKYGSINVYNVTVANLQAFAEERFANIDLGNYVTKLFRVYCGVGDTLDSKMNVGNFNLNINVKTPVTDVQTVDCGTLTVNGKNGTANDFKGELQIMLPFIGFQSINIDKALNNPLHLYYKINIVTGESVAILEINSIPAYYWDCKACLDILYLSREQENFSNYEFTSKFLYGFVPFIVYKYNTDFNTSTVNSDAVREKVMNCVGYFEMTETTPFNAPNMNETERAKIIELLNSGVFYGAEFE